MDIKVARSLPPVEDTWRTATASTISWPGWFIEAAVRGEQRKWETVYTMPSPEELGQHETFGAILQQMKRKGDEVWGEQKRREVIDVYIYVHASPDSSYGLDRRREGEG